MANSSRLGWPYPDENDKSWWSKFLSMVTAQDASGYAAREDRSLILTGGGVLTWDSATSTFSWDNTIEVLSPISGFYIAVDLGSLTVEEGESVVVVLTRAPTAVVVTDLVVSASVPNTDDAYVLCVRRNDLLYFRNGNIMADGVGSMARFGNSDAVVFDDASASAQSNIRSNRLLDQSPVDGTKTQITNLGSFDGTQNGEAVGAISKGATIGGGNDHSASGNYSTVSGGNGNSAMAAEATVAGGLNNLAESVYSTVSGGYDNVASANYAAVAGGHTNVVDSGDGSAIGGGHDNYIGTSASNSVISGGYSNLIQAASSSVISGGYSNYCKTGSNQSVISGGVKNEVNAYWSSIPGGFGVKTMMPGQFSVGAGGFTNPIVVGEAQTSLMVARGKTAGAGINETAQLLLGDNGSMIPDTYLTLEDGKAYAFRVTLVAGGTQAGPVRKSRTMEIKFNARRDAGLTVITASGTGDAYGDAATATWTLVASVGVTPDRLVLTFGTGAGAASACHAVACVEFTEVAY